MWELIVAFKYDENLVKRPFQEMNYTNEQILELYSCMEDISYFLKYAIIVHPDRGRILFRPYPFQNDILDKMKDHRFIICKIPRQMGKMLDIDTDIITPSGFIKLKDLKVGDVIYGSDGKKTTITYITETMYNKPCYKIEFSHGETLIAGDEHLWTWYDPYLEREITDNTIKLLDRFNFYHGKGKSISIKHTEPLQFDKKETLVDPYFLGLWLGDGCKNNTNITCSYDDYIEYKKIFLNKDISITDFIFDKRTENTGYFYIKNTVKTFKELNLIKNKHIPDEYIFNDINIRIELLKGLMDSDGTVEKNGTCRFYQSNKVFIEQVRFLLSSLGIKSTIRCKKTTNKDCYVLCFVVNDFDIFNLPRKLDQQRLNKNHPKNKRIYINSINKVDSVPSRCLQVDNENHLFLAGKTLIPTHNTVVVSVYSLWYAIFNGDKTIGIVSNKQASAVDILNRIKIIYSELPSWLKPGITEYNKLNITFDNGTKIMVSATSEDAFRGRTLNLLFCDELGFVRSGIADNFWAANYPAIAASQESKIIIISTPNGMYNLYHRLWSDAEKGFNTFIPITAHYSEIPERDDKWAEEQLKNLGRRRFTQEILCEFLGSVNTVIDAETLEKLYDDIKEPILIDMKGRFNVYEKPVKGGTYVIGVDQSKGTGEHYSTCQVFKINSIKPVSFEQVAVFKDNLTGIYEFSEIVNRLSIYYNNAYSMVENNAEGSVIVNRLWWDFENGGLVNSGSKTVDLGIRATKSTKPKAVLLLKKLIEDGSISIVDRDTVYELSSFIEENGRFHGKDMPDDLVSAMYWATYILNMNIFDESFEFDKKQEEDTDVDIWGVLSDVQSNDDFGWISDKINNTGFFT